MLKLNLSSLKHMKEVSKAELKPSTVYLLTYKNTAVSIVQTGGDTLEGMRILCYARRRWVDAETLQDYAFGAEEDEWWAPSTINEAVPTDVRIYETGISQNILKNLELEVLKHLHIVEDLCKS